MAWTPAKDKEATGVKKPETLAEVLFYIPDAKKRKELEKYRVEYEAEHGETDLTKRYTSTWRDEEQLWLMKHDAKRYFDGLPPFAKAYLKGIAQDAAADGRLDDLSSNLLRLFVAGQMRLDYETPDR